MAVNLGDTSQVVPLSGSAGRILLASDAAATLSPAGVELAPDSVAVVETP